MKQLRVGLGVTTFCALIASSAPANANFVDIVISNPNITIMRPATGVTSFSFNVSVTNTSAYVLDFEFATDVFENIGGITIPALYQGPGPLTGQLQYTDPVSGDLTFGGPDLMLPLRPCGHGVSLVCLHPNETFVGNIAMGTVGWDTAAGLYAVTQDGAGSPAFMTFKGTYVLNGATASFTEVSGPFSVNVVAGNAVPEPHPWMLVMAGVAGVLLISTKRIRH